MNRYRVKIQTVKQYLNGSADYLSVYAYSKDKADFKVMDLIAILEQGIDILSAHRIYSYEFI